MIIDRIQQAISILTRHPGFSRYFANTSWLFIEQLLRLGIGLLVGVWVARYLGPEQFGLMSYVLAFVAIFSPIARFGLDKLLVRELVSKTASVKEQLGTSYLLRLMGALIGFCLIWLASFATSQTQVVSLYILIVASALFFQSFEVIELYFQSQVQSKNIAISKLVQLFVSTALKLYFIWVKAPLLWFIFIFLIEQLVLVAALSWRYYQCAQPSFITAFNRGLFKQYLRQTWPIILSGIVLMVQTRIDHVMLKAMAGDATLGYFSAANRLIEALGFIPGLLVNALFPAILNAKQFSSLQYRWRMYNLYRLMMALFLLVAIPLFVWGEQIILLLYGTAYFPAGVLLSVMSLRVLLINYDVVRNAYLVAENRIVYGLISAALGALINVLLNFYWIPKYQAMGAVAATLVSFFITTFVFDLFHRAMRGNLFNMYKSFLLFNFLK